MEKEIERIDGTAIMLQADIDPAKIKRDGWPYADAKSRAHPGVIISFVRKGKRLFFACDEYELWQHNVRGILLTLELLRGIARHGVAQSEEQYEGFGRQLPPKASPAAEARTHAHAAQSKSRTPTEKAADSCAHFAHPRGRDFASRRRGTGCGAGTSGRDAKHGGAAAGLPCGGENVHPDLGGSHNDAVNVNAAYEMLGGG